MGSKVSFSSAILATFLLLSLAILATFVLLSTANARVTAEVIHASPFCKDDFDRSRFLCTIMARGANRWPVAMTNMIRFAKERAKARKAIAYGVAGKLPGDVLPESKKSIDSTCKKAYDRLIPNLERCMGLVKNGPTSALRYYLSSLTIFDCKNALEEVGVSLHEVNRYDGFLTGMRSTLLDVLQKNPEYV